jgi:hypothetical protein
MATWDRLWTSFGQAKVYSLLASYKSPPGFEAQVQPIMKNGARTRYILFFDSTAMATWVA